VKPKIVYLMARRVACEHHSLDKKSVWP